MTSADEGRKLAGEGTGKSKDRKSKEHIETGK